MAFTDADIGRFQWVNDDWLVFNGVDLEAGGGDQRFAPGLFSVKRDGSELQTLFDSQTQFICGFFAQIDFKHLGQFSMSALCP